MFENTDCERCGHRLGYLPDRRILSAVQPDRGNWIGLAAKGLPYFVHLLGYCHDRPGDHEDDLNEIFEKRDLAHQLAGGFEDRLDGVETDLCDAPGAA